MRQTSSHKQNWKVALSKPVHGHDPCPQFVLGHILEFINEKDQRCLRLTGGLDEVGAGNGAELWADEDGGAAGGRVLEIALGVGGVGADVAFAGKRGDGGEGDAVRLRYLLDAGGFEVL